MAKTRSIEGKIEEVEKYEYLMVEYIKEISNGMTYLVLIVTTLFLFILVNVSSAFPASDQALSYVKMALAIMMIGGFCLFGISSIIKKNIEKKFERILS